MTKAQHTRALHIITNYCIRHRLSASGLALMFEALDRAEADDGGTAGAIREQFPEPLASGIVRAVWQGVK